MSVQKFLGKILSRPVIVKLNTGEEYRGILVCIDGFLNVAMEQAEEFTGGKPKHYFGDAFIRGNN
ncbi:MAG: putative U6 small ribonucleoprotein F, partial [Streblomastix strix]